MSGKSKYKGRFYSEIFNKTYVRHLKNLAKIGAPLEFFEVPIGIPYIYSSKIYIYASCDGKYFLRFSFKLSFQ